MGEANDFESTPVSSKGWDLGYIRTWGANDVFGWASANDYFMVRSYQALVRPGLIARKIAIKRPCG